MMEPAFFILVDVPFPGERFSSLCSDEALLHCVAGSGVVTLQPHRGKRFYIAVRLLEGPVFTCL